LPRFHLATQTSPNVSCASSQEAQSNTMENMAAERHGIQDWRWKANDANQKTDTYEVRPREDHHGVDLISDVLPFGRLLYLDVREAVAYAKFHSRSHDAVIRVYDAAGNVIETHSGIGDFKKC
jgi:hypothetical protein